MVLLFAKRRKKQRIKILALQNLDIKRRVHFKACVLKITDQKL